MARGAFVLAAVASLGACARGGARDAPGLTVNGGELRLVTTDGRVLHSRELVGATLTVDGRRIRLVEVERASMPRGRAYLRHHFVVNGDDGQVRELCAADPTGERWALAFGGERGGVRLACTAGAIGKCASFGYWPDELATAELHAACVRMIRADYGGDGATATREGIGIDFCDRAGIIPCDDPDRPLEAAWSRDGAVCVAEPRIAELATLAELERRYPRLRGHLGPSCTLAAATRDPSAVLFGLALVRMPGERPQPPAKPSARPPLLLQTL